LYRSIDKEDILQLKSNIRRHFVYTDLQLIIKDSDAVVLYYDESVRLGAGTLGEAQVAYNHDIPIFLVSAYDNWYEEVPGWLQSITTKIFTNFEDLYKYLGKLPPGIIKRDIYGNHHAGQHYLCSLCGEPFKKNKHHFVSTVSPLYCNTCVDVVDTTHERHTDRYDFFISKLEKEIQNEIFEEREKEK